MRLSEACRFGQELLERAGVPEAGLDAWYLLEYISGYTRNDYYGHPELSLDGEQEAAYREALERRARRVPLQHITGEQEFMGLPFYVTDQVLIPRQDTEILVEAVLKVLRAGMRLLDMCTGSGCILLSLLHHCPGVCGVGADISGEALRVAERNNARLQTGASLVQSDLFEAVTGSFDVIVSNPPYIRREEIPHLMEEVRCHEPLLALDGHEDGLYFYRRLVKEARAYLVPGGSLYLEIGCDQGGEVLRLLKEQGFEETEIFKDLAGLDRVVKGVCPK